MRPGKDLIIVAAFFQDFASSALSSDLDFLPTLYLQAGVNGPLSNAVAATGSALISRRTGDTSSMLVAREHYHIALEQTRQVLKRPTSAKSDELLMTTIVLGLFEAGIKYDTWAPGRHANFT